MGVHGLWPLLEPVGRRVNIEALTNKKLAVGEYCFLPFDITNITRHSTAVMPSCQTARSLPMKLAARTLDAARLLCCLCSMFAFTLLLLQANIGVGISGIARSKACSPCRSNSHL